MKLLQLNRTFFVWMNLYPTDEFEGRRKYFPVVTAVIIISIAVLALIASSLFIHRNLETNFKDCLLALSQNAGLLTAIYMWIVTYAHRSKLIKIFTRFQQIHDTSEDYILIGYFDKANRRSNFAARLFVLYMNAFFLAELTVMGVANVIYCVFVYGQINGDALHTQLNFVLPWDQKTLMGWIALNVFCTLVAFSYLGLQYSILSFFIGVCLLQEALSKYFKALVRELDEIDDVDHRRIRSQLVKLVRLHNLTKELFDETSDFFSPLILIVLISSMSFMANSLFLFDLALHGNFLDMGISVYALCSTGCILFLYCYSGERTTQNYLSFDQLIFDSKWHRLPIYLQKELIMIIAAAQRPSEYHGSGLAFLNLNTFCRMLQVVLKYYMAFKTLTSE